MTAALLISTYNWPQAFHVVLQSAIQQTVAVNEILIADDGSTAETKELIEQLQKQTSIPLKHFWQEDKGFRKSKILNKAIAGTKVDYIIQVDGDCIMHPRFVEDHLKAATKGVYLYGARVNILPDFVDAILSKLQLKFSIFSKEIKNKSRAIHAPFLSGFYKTHDGVSGKFRGCNVSFWRKDVIDVNGYNEDFEGWGREDSDLVIRMSNNGIRAKRLRYAGIVYHIYHKINSKHNFEENDKRQNETIANKITFIEKGVSQYLD